MLRKAFNSWGFDVVLLGFIVTICGLSWHYLTPDFEDFGTGVSQVGEMILTLGLFITVIQLLISRRRKPKLVK
jgi:hypothetical protein